VDITIGLFITTAGVALASWGAYRLLRPRRPADVEWIRRNPLSNLTLGGAIFGFDRSGALACLIVGFVAVLVGIGVLAAS
jgi:hypothetical protein